MPLHHRIAPFVKHGMSQFILLLPDAFVNDFSRGINDVAATVVHVVLWTHHMADEIIDLSLVDGILCCFITTNKVNQIFYILHVLLSTNLNL